MVANLFICLVNNKNNAFYTMAGHPNFGKIQISMQRFHLTVSYYVGDCQSISVGEHFFFNKLDQKLGKFFKV